MFALYLSMHWKIPIISPRLIQLVISREDLKGMIHVPGSKKHKAQVSEQLREAEWSLYGK